jgi:hypothetical protein
MKIAVFCCAAALLPVTVWAQASAPTDDYSGTNGAPPPSLAADPGYAGTFQCPESFASDEQRRSATKDYLAWASRTHPEWRVDETLSYRTSLLQMHGCNASLDTEVTNLPQVDR